MYKGYNCMMGIFVICILYQILLGSVNEGERQACKMYRRDKKFIQNFDQKI
jgi:hypothetical protein